MTHALLAEAGFSRDRFAAVRTGLTVGPPEEIRLVARDLGVAGVCNIYGSIESYGNCCATGAPLERRVHSQGPPLMGVELKIVDPETRKELGADEVGEILVECGRTRGSMSRRGADEVVSGRHMF